VIAVGLFIYYVDSVRQTVVAISDIPCRIFQHYSGISNFFLHTKLNVPLLFQHFPALPFTVVQEIISNEREYSIVLLSGLNIEMKETGPR
jgi:hypothetical protein